jgi:hypothetical protein
MLNSFLKSLVNYKYNDTIEPKLRDGRFTVVNESRATFNVKGDKYHTNLFLQTDFSLTNFKPSVRTNHANVNFLGYNKKYISDSGTYDFITAVEEFSKTTMGNRMTRAEAVALSATNIYADSHEAFILNMLISWYTAKLYSDTSGKDRILKLKQSGYRDTHVGISIQGQLTENTIEYELGSPNPASLAGSTWTFRDATNFWSRPYVLRYNCGQAEQAYFYMAHVVGRSGQSQINADIQIEPANSGELLLDPVGGEHDLSYKEDAIPWDKPGILWLWIIDYVKLNRVEHAFAAAFELLSTLAAQPMPSFQESTMWNNMSIVVTLSKFSPTRARVRSNFEGEPLVADTTPHEFIINDGVHPSNSLFAGSIMNYYFWIGLQATVDNYARSISKWDEVFLAHDDELAILSGHQAHSAMISIATGKHVPTMMTESAFVSYDMTAMYGKDRIYFTEVTDDQYPTSIQLEGINPYVSGSLVIGSVVGTLATTQHLTALQEINVDEYQQVLPEDAILLANAYRLFGNDVSLAHSRTREEYATYAAVREAVINPAQILDRTRDFDRIEVVRSGARQGRHTELPTASTLRGTSGITLTITTPNLEVVAWRHPQVRAGITLAIPGKRRPVTFTVKAGETYKSVVMRPRKIPASDKADFHIAGVDINPDKPIIGARPLLQKHGATGDADTEQSAIIGQSSSVVGVE